MAAIENNLFDIRTIDALAEGRSGLHRLDPRAKLVTFAFFIITVVSIGKYEIAMMMPFFIFPAAMAAFADLPLGYLLKKVLLVSPFAVLIGILNPFLDTQPLIWVGPVPLSGGWVSFISILIRFFLTVSAALILVSLTGFNAVCLALQKLKVPMAFVVQLMFLYRYLFVLVDEAAVMIRARALRSFSSKGISFKVFVPLLGQLLLRTLDRAQRIHLAMCCRGFDGHVRLLKPLAFGSRDFGFILGWSLFFILARTVNLPVLIGRILQGFFS